MTLCHILPERRGWVNMIVHASHTMFEGIPGIYWRWKVAHHWYRVRLADRWTSTWMCWHDLLLGDIRWANQLVYLHRQGMQHDVEYVHHYLLEWPFRAGVMIMGSRGRLEAIVAQVGQFALKLWMDAFIPGQETIIGTSFHAIHALVGCVQAM